MKQNLIWYTTISFEKSRVAVVQQFYETRVIDEFVLRGNTATLKCLIPSFVADFVDVIEWQDEDGSIYTANSQQEKGTYIDCTKLILTKWRNNYKFLSHILFLNPIILQCNYIFFIDNFFYFFISFISFPISLKFLITYPSFKAFAIKLECTIFVSDE